jgi:hypothetical protein
VTTPRLPRTAARLGAFLGGAAGATLATCPEAVAHRVGDKSSVPVGIVRLLGLRMVAQAVVEIVRPDRRVLWCGAGVEAAHGASMLAARAVWPQYRRSATASAAIAFGFAAVGIVTGWARR